MTTIPLHAEQWMLDAACRGKPSEWWFPPKEGGPGAHIYRKAREVCNNCSVREDCLRWAMDIEGLATKGHRYGMAGGLTPMERVALSERGQVCEVCGRVFRSARRRRVCGSRECELALQRERQRRYVRA